MEQLKLKDFLNYRFLSAVRYAPDGKRAVFVVSNSNEEENRDVDVEKIEALIAKRTEAKKNKDFDTADAISKETSDIKKQVSHIATTLNKIAPDEGMLRKLFDKTLGRFIEDKETERERQKSEQEARDAEAKETVANIAHDNAKMVMDLSSFMPTNPESNI